MKKFKLIDEIFVVHANKRICEEHGHKHVCLRSGGVSSALHTAFYPGVPPFAHGGIAGMAGALFYYLIKSHNFFDANKRTAVISSLAFMEINDWSLKYSISITHDAFADLAENCASGEKNIDMVKDWFEAHKIKH